ncbi:hypothetical protein MNV84_02958 [Leishmania braziliensis]|nr:hypothetical protein MNV84_02958 [Leishmania braziliensis]
MSPSATGSPYVCLSTQCDTLYRIGSQQHNFAFISEQSVYTRAAEQLRFFTPSPKLLSSVGRPSIGSDRAELCKRAGNDVDPLPPHVYMSAQPPHPFPSIERLEAAQRAALKQEEAQAKVRHRSSTASVMVSGDWAATTSALHDVLVPSGSLLAQRTYRYDYEDRRRKVRIGTTAAAPRRDTLEQTVCSSHKDSLQTSSPLLQLIFPSSVLLRAVAQMVLTLQTSSSTSAARFALAQYRGAELLPWRTRFHEVQEPAAPSTSRLSPEALVVSVLPQVVADRVASRARMSSGQLSSLRYTSRDDMDTTTLYALTPSVDLLTNMGPRGAKREREVTQRATQKGTAGNAAEVNVLAGTILCERLATTTEASAAQAVPVCYAAVSADEFEGWASKAGKGNASPRTLLSTAYCAPDTLLYEEESTWMTDGVFHPLFSLPLALPTDSSVVADANTPIMEHNSCSGSHTTHLTFLKTSAFLFLSFLVHRSWCVHVHSAVTQAMAAHQRPSNTEQQTGSSRLVFTGTHVICLPPVHEVRRSTQYEWKSRLIYRAHEMRTAGCATTAAVRPLESNEEVRGGALVASTATKSLHYRPVVWQLEILAVSRNAQLQWCMCNTTLAACVGAGLAVTPLPHNMDEGILNGSGTLSELLEQL